MGPIYCNSLWGQFTAIPYGGNISFSSYFSTVSFPASIVLERGASFDRGDLTITYFTIGTFYSTYSHTVRPLSQQLIFSYPAHHILSYSSFLILHVTLKYPMCIQEDPGPKIRGSVAMSYLTLFVLTLCAQVISNFVQLNLTFSPFIFYFSSSLLTNLAS